MSNNEAEKLVGKWRSDPTDEAALKSFGNITLEFSDDGALTYTIHEEERDKIIYLTYAVFNGMLVTDQPSAPKKECTPYILTNDGKLTLIYDGEYATFIRLD